jgi:hypothetical protein
MGDDSAGAIAAIADDNVRACNIRECNVRARNVRARNIGEAVTWARR